MMKLGVFLTVLTAATTVPAQEPRPFEIADYYRTAFVGAPRVSPDGTRIVVAVTRYDLEQARSRSEIWSMDGFGSRPRQLTFGGHHDTDPSLSPDGRVLAFVSDREGAEGQLYVMPMDGGEARQLTRFPVGLSRPVWSPDGRWIAVTARVYPECGAEADCNRTRLDESTRGPLAVRVAEALPFREWDRWREGRVRHVLLVDVASGEVVRDLTPGPWDSPPFAVDGASGYSFSPDGGVLCFASKRVDEPARSTNSDLWLVSLDDTAVAQPPRNLTAANPGWDGDPVFSPDGRQIAFRSQRAPGYESDLFRLAVIDVASGEVRYPTELASYGQWVTAAAWLPDGRLVFEAEENGRNPLYVISSNGRGLRRVMAEGALVGWDPTPDGGSVVFTRSQVGSPPEVYRAALGDGAAVRLTRFNSELEDEVDIRPAREMSVKAADGRDIQVFVVTPHGFDPTARYPLILNVHGGPQVPWRDRYRGDWQVYPGKGYVVAFANPTGSAGFGQDTVDAIACDWGGRVFDDLMAVADELAKIPWVDRDRMGVMGWSYGGYMVMWIAGHSDRFQALASMMGVYDLRSMFGSTEELWFVEHDLCGRPWDSEDYRRWSPSEFAPSFKTPTLVITGERDFRVPYTQSLQFFTDLQVMGVPSRLIVFPDAGHWPGFFEMAFYYLAHLDWFHQWLGGEPPEWDLEDFASNRVFGGDATLATPRQPDGEAGD